MANWHERLAEALAARKKTAAQLARFCGVKPPSVSDWMSGKTKMIGGKNSASVCQFLSINSEWLFDGKLPSGLENKPNDTESTRVKTNGLDRAAADYRHIPVLNYVQAGNPRNVFDDYFAGGGMDEVLTDLELGPHAFALIIRGESMAPEFKDGDKVIIDPSVTPRPGEFVIAKCNGDEATFKKYRPRGTIDGNDVFELVPLNEDYATIRSDQVDCVIIGTMVEHRRYRRQ